MADDFNWVDSGASAMAIADNIIKVLIAKGVITPNERAAILDQAIADLETNPSLKQAADNIRNIFKRP